MTTITSIKMIPKIFLHLKEYIDCYYASGEEDDGNPTQVEDIGKFLGISTLGELIHFNWGDTSNENISKITLLSNGDISNISPVMEFDDLWPWISALTGDEYVPPGAYAGDEGSRGYAVTSKESVEYLYPKTGRREEPIRIRWLYEVVITGDSYSSTRIFPDPNAERPYYEAVINAYGTYSFSSATVDKRPYGDMSWEGEYGAGGTYLGEIGSPSSVSLGDTDPDQKYIALDAVSLGGTLKSVEHHMSDIFLMDSEVEGFTSLLPTSELCDTNLYDRINEAWELKNNSGTASANIEVDCYRIMYAWHKAAAFLVGLIHGGEDKYIKIYSSGPGDDEYIVPDLSLDINAVTTGPIISNADMKNILCFKDSEVVFPVHVSNVDEEEDWVLNKITYMIEEYAYYDGAVWKHEPSPTTKPSWEHTPTSTVGINKTGVTLYNHDMGNLDNIITKFSLTALTEAEALVMRLSVAVECGNLGNTSTSTISDIFIKVGMGDRISLADQNTVSDGTYIQINQSNVITSVTPEILISQIALQGDKSSSSYPIMISKVYFRYGTSEIVIYDNTSGCQISKITYNSIKEIIKSRTPIVADSSNNAVTAEGTLKVDLVDSMDETVTAETAYSMERVYGVSVSAAPVGAHYDSEVEAVMVVE
jgi:hypothetical protein